MHDTLFQKDPGPACTSSTTGTASTTGGSSTTFYYCTLAKGTTRVANVLTIYAWPTITPPSIYGGNPSKCAALREDMRSYRREPLRTVDGSALSADGLGSGMPFVLPYHTCHISMHFCPRLVIFPTCNSVYHPTSKMRAFETWF